MGPKGFRGGSSANEPVEASLPAQKRSRFPFPFRNPERVKTFLAVTTEPNLAVLLECFFTAHLIRKRNRNFAVEIVAPPEARNLIEATGLFDTIHLLSPGGSLTERLSELKHNVLYIPEPDIKTRLSALFVRGKIRIGGSRLRLVSFLMKHYRNDSADDLEAMKNRGLDLFPEISELRIDLESQTTRSIPEGSIWLSIFDPNSLSVTWPAGHAARLIRLLGKIGKTAVVPVYEHVTDELRQELKEGAKNLLFLEEPDLDRRIQGMMESDIVIGQAGPETLLGSLLGKRVIELHDIRYKKEQIEGRFGGAGSDSPRIRPLLSYVRAAGALKKSIQPPSLHCINHCERCEFHSCIEYISPERVFEAVKKSVLPF